MMKFIIRKMPEKINGTYIGMNYEAAKHHVHLKNYKGKNKIKIWSKLNKKEIKLTKRHEIIEALLMQRGHEYKYAHRIALREEKTKLPIKEVLRRYA